MSVKTYRLRRVHVRAIQVAVDNTIEVERFLSELQNDSVSYPRAYPFCSSYAVRTSKGVVLAAQSSWIVDEGLNDKLVSVLSPLEFVNKYCEDFL